MTGSGRGSQRGRIVLASALAASIALTGIAPSAADAKKKRALKPGPVFTESARTSVSANEAIATAVAYCAPKERVVGGGFYETPPTGPSATGAQGYVFESRRVGARAWQVSSQYFDAPPAEPFTLVAYAYCRSGVPPLSEVETVGTALPPGNTYHVLTPTCTGKRKAVSGGFRAAPPLSGPGVLGQVFDSYRAGPRSWLMRYWNTPPLGGGPNSFSAYAYCAKVKHAPPDTVVAGPVSTMNRSAGTVSAPCSRKAGQVQGGFAQATTSLGDSYFIVNQSQRFGQNWFVSGQHSGSAPDNLFAHCG